MCRIRAMGFCYRPEGSRKDYRVLKHQGYGDDGHGMARGDTMFYILLFLCTFFPSKAVSLFISPLFIHPHLLHFSVYSEQKMRQWTENRRDFRWRRNTKGEHEQGNCVLMGARDGIRMGV
jgi:hypothetical protein